MRACSMNAASPSFIEIELTTPLPCRHLRPASITLHFDESTITGMRAMSGSDAIRVRKRVIAFAESIRPSSMLTSRICAPLATCCLATSTASSKRSSLMSLRNCALPVTLVRSPTLTNSSSGVMTSGSRPDRRVGRMGLLIGTCGFRSRGHAEWHRARRDAGDDVGDGADVPRRGAAATADEVDQPRARELADQRGHLFRCLVVFAERGRQAGIGMRADLALRDLRQHVDVLAQLLRAERAVEPDRDRPRVR